MLPLVTSLMCFMNMHICISLKKNHKVSKHLYIANLKVIKYIDVNMDA